MYVPKNYRSTLDYFTFVLIKAPDFPNPPTKHALTLDEVVGGLDAGIVGVASRVKNPEALALFEKCREEVKATHQLYKEGKIPEAKRNIQAAEKLFKQAAKLRSSKSAESLVEDDGQP